MLVPAVIEKPLGVCKSTSGVGEGRKRLNGMGRAEWGSNKDRGCARQAQEGRGSVT